MASNEENSEFDLADSRLDEAIALIETFSLDADLRDCVREKASRSEALSILGIASNAPDREAAIEDIAAVLAAYSYASEHQSTRLKNVQFTLQGVRRDVDGVINKLGLFRPTDFPGVRARMMIEEEALRSALVAELPQERPANRFQVTATRRSLRAVSRGGRVRRSRVNASGSSRHNSAVARLPVTIDLARRFGLSEEHEAIAVRCAEDTFEQLWGGIAILAAAIDNALKTFPEPTAKYLDPTDQKAAAKVAVGKAAAMNVIPPGMVLAWGGLELLVAWAPDRRPSTTGAQRSDRKDGGNLSNLLSVLHSSLEFDDKDRELRSPQRFAVAAWKAGRHAVLFDGRTKLTRVQRVTGLRNRELDEYYGDYEEGP